MEHRRLHYWILFIILLLTTLSARILPKPRPNPQDHKLAFFKATREDMTIYLFGSINGTFKPHIGYPLPDRIFQALNNSDLYLYSSPTDSDDPSLLEKMTLTTQSWEDLIGEEEALNLTNIIRSLAVSPEAQETLLQYHPWLVLQIVYYNTIHDLGFYAMPEEETLFDYASNQDIKTLSLPLLPIEARFIETTSSQYAPELYYWIKMHLIFLTNGFNLAEALQNAWLQGNITDMLDQLVISRTPQFDMLHTEEIQLYDMINQTIWQSITAEEEAQAMTFFLTLSADYLLDEGGFASFLEENNFTITRA